ncbi:MAG: hypothetical protein ACK4GN_01650 [Runella sp.]
MRRKFGDYERLLHILEAIQDIESFLDSMPFEDFVNSKLHRADNWKS